MLALIEFLGTKPSHGYIPNKVYKVEINGDWVKPVGGYPEALPYEVEGFLLNWKIIEIYNQ